MTHKKFVSRFITEHKKLIAIIWINYFLDCQGKENNVTFLMVHKFDQILFSVFTDCYKLKMNRL